MSLRKTNLLLLLCFICNTAFCHTFEVDGIFYTKTSSTTVAVDTETGTDTWTTCCYSGDIYIPDYITYDGVEYAVTSVTQDAFNCNTAVTSIFFGDNIESIGGFRNGNSASASALQSIHLGKKFRYVSNSSINDSQRRLYIFGYNAPKLQSLTVDADNPYFTSYDNCLYNKDLTRLYCVPAANTGVKIAPTTKIIGDLSFGYFQGRSVQLPEGVTDIMQNAFFSSRIQEMHLPQSVRLIEYAAFSSCPNLTTFTMGDQVEKMGWQILMDTPWERARKCPIYLNNWLYMCGVDENDELIIPEGIVGMATDGDRNSEFKSVRKIVFPSTFKYFYDSDLDKAFLQYNQSGSSFFYNLENLEEVDIQSSDAETIPSGYFYGCAKLERVTIPAGIKAIKAFQDCPAINKVTCLATTPPTLKINTWSTAFSSIAKNAKLYVPEEAIEQYRTADVWKDFMTIRAYCDNEIAQQPDYTDCRVRMTKPNTGETYQWYRLPVQNFIGCFYASAYENGWAIKGGKIIAPKQGESTLCATIPVRKGDGISVEYNGMMSGTAELYVNNYTTRKYLSPYSTPDGTLDFVANADGDAEVMIKLLSNEVENTDFRISAIRIYRDEVELIPYFTEGIGTSTGTQWARTDNVLTPRNTSRQVNYPAQCGIKLGQEMKEGQRIIVDYELENAQKLQYTTYSSSTSYTTINSGTYSGTFQLKADVFSKPSAFYLVYNNGGSYQNETVRVTSVRLSPSFGYGASNDAVELPGQTDAAYNMDLSEDNIDVFCRITLPNGDYMDTRTVNICKDIMLIDVDVYEGSEEVKTLHLAPWQLQDFQLKENSLAIIDSESKGLEGKNIVRRLESGRLTAERIELTDAKPFYCPADIHADELTYVRDFDHTRWHAWYVPFDMPYNDIADHAHVAFINNVRQYDDDDDGMVDRALLEFISVKSGSLQANWPYVIKPDTEGATTFDVRDIILRPTIEETAECSSLFTRFTFTGSYQPRQNLGDAYVMVGGEFRQVAAAEDTLLPFRFSLVITSKLAGQMIETPKLIMSVDGKIEDEDGEGVTGITDVLLQDEATGRIYDLQGRPVSQPRHGIYVRDGKKIMVK